MAVRYSDNIIERYTNVSSIKKIFENHVDIFVSPDLIIDETTFNNFKNFINNHPSP